MSNRVTDPPRELIQTDGTTRPLRNWMQSVSNVLDIPAFRADRNGTSQTGVVSGVETVMQLNNDSAGQAFDTHDYYDITTYRYTPLVAGYYHLGAGCFFSVVTAGTDITVEILKNGVIAIQAIDFATGTVSPAVNCSGPLLLNGSTDYITFQCYHNSGSNQSLDGLVRTTYAWGFRLPT